MKQEEFFKLLDRRLSMIEDSERSDILDEYRQHIAMKIKEGGIPEEQALADFGDVDSLADEILSAYHVRTDTDTAKKNPERIRAFLLCIKQTARRTWQSICSCFRQCCSRISGFCSRCSGAVRSVFQREPKEKAAEPVCEHKTCLRRFFSSAGCALHSAAHGFAAALRTLLRWCCNLLFGAGTVILWLCTALLLIGFGILLMLNLQGYPLLGAAILSFGMLLCSISAAFLLCGMIRRKKHPVTEGESENA